MAHYPEDLLYSKEHEWIRVEGDVAILGITDFAQSTLGDIVFVELPKIGDRIKDGQAIGVIESIKSVNDIYTPISGEILAINEELLDTPEKINEAPYDSWMAKVKIVDSSQLSILMKATDYKNFTNS